MAFGNSLDTDLVAYYSFNANANDVSGNGWDGTLQGNASISSAQKKLGVASASFPGGEGDGCFLYGGLLTGWSISAWVRHSSAAWKTNEDCVTWTGGHYDCVFNNGQPQNADRSLTHPTVLATETWYHVVWLSDTAGAGTTIIVNGDWAGRANSAGGSQLWPQRMGDSTTAGREFQGHIDEVGIWNRELTQAEVEQLYNGGMGFPYETAGVDGVVTSNGTGGGMWSAGSTWLGGVKPGVLNRVVIQASDTVYIDEDVVIGDGNTSISVYQLDILGNLVWRNQTGDASANWTFTVDGAAIRILGPSGRWFIGTEDNSLFGANSVGPIPATRTAKVEFSIAYYTLIRFDDHETSTSMFEFWGAENYHQRAPDIITGQTVDSAANKYSFVDAGRNGDTVEWQGSWLEITAGKNKGQRREVTDFDNGTNTISWSQNQPMPDACDSTSVYSLRHNYHRAMLEQDAGSGTSEIYLDRNADWEVGDELIVACGRNYDSTVDRPERVEIAAKTSAKQYTIVGTFTYSHVAEDFVVHLSKNIIFKALDLTGGARGYRFERLGGAGNFFKVSWVFFDQAGTDGSALFARTSGNYVPMVKHVTAYGYLEGAANTTDRFMNFGSDLGELTEEYWIEDVHIINFTAILDIGTRLISNRPLEDKLYLAFRDFTVLGLSASGSSYPVFGTDLETSITPRYYNLWATGITLESGSISNGWIFNAGVCLQVDGFRFYRVARGFYLRGASASSPNMIGESPSGEAPCIRNGVIYQPSAYGVYIQANASNAKFVIENVDVRDAGNAAINIGDCATAVFYLINNKYNGCVRGLVFTEQSGPNIFEDSGEYGVETENSEANIDMNRDGGRFDESGVKYLSHNTKYVTPTSPNWNELDINKIFTMSYTGSTLFSRKMRTFLARTRLEAVTPIVDSVEQHSQALTHAATLVEVLEHPTEPRVNSNIKLKITPYVALYAGHVNLTKPLMTYLNEGDDVTVSVWFRKNISLPEGHRPTLTILGNGVYQSKQMTDVIDTWEKVSISFVARYSGTLLVWFSAYNKLLYPKDDLSGYNGVPDAQGTVVVYADEFDVAIVE